MLTSPCLPSLLSFVVPVLLLLAAPLRAEVPSECLQSWTKGHPKHAAKRSGPTDLAPGARELELDTVNLAAEGERTLRFTVRAPGRLQVRNAGGDLFDASLHLLSSPDRKNDRTARLGTLEKGKTVAVPVIPGEYQVRLEESGEFEEPMCPPRSYRVAVKVTPPDPAIAPLLRGSWADETTVTAAPSPATYQATVAALNAEPTFVATLEKPSLVEVTLAQDEPPPARLLLNGHPQGPRLRALVPGGRFSFSFERAEGAPLDRVDAVRFTLKAEPLLGERVFGSIPEKAVVEVLDRVAAKVVLKNLAPLDFRKVTLHFDPTFTGAATPPGMTAIAGKRRTSWTTTFDGWKAGEEKIVDFGVLFPRVQRIQSYYLSVNVTTLETQDGPIQVRSEHLLKEEISLSRTAKASSPQSGLAVDQANTVEHPDYETQLKIPVMTNCAKRHPQYGEPFQKCQGLVFQWRNRCSATLRVTTPEFVECVRKGLQGEAPELLTRP